MPPIARFVLAGLVLLTHAVPRAAGPLDDMVEAERMFARMAEARGIRDSFIAFFSADSIALVPEPVLAVERLRGRPSRPFSEAELRWEPRAGDIAASGELGWLTGPSTYVDRAAQGPPQYGNYLSIWRRESASADGPATPWRVYIDFGCSTPSPAPFPDGFSQVQLPARYTGAAVAGDTSAADADRALNTAVAARGLAAYADVLAADGSRLHRQDTIPAVGRSAIVAALGRDAASWTFTHIASGMSASADLAYAYGSYSSGAAKGGYIRIWSRDASGAWRLMVDATT